jgi:hypothetical protein
MNEILCNCNTNASDSHNLAQGPHIFYCTTLASTVSFAARMHFLLSSRAVKKLGHRRRMQNRIFIRAKIVQFFFGSPAIMRRWTVPDLLSVTHSSRNNSPAPRVNNANAVDMMMKKMLQLIPLLPSAQGHNEKWEVASQESTFIY